MTRRELHISSLMVHGHPADLPAVRARIGAVPGAEVALCDPSGRMVVTLETGSQGDVADALTRIALLDGVLSAALVFHHVEEDE
jgi:periplasmic nitrate reductase NapD